MNIMLVTVTERTREIGLRMAVGASRRAVLEQFLTESVVISMGGGVDRNSDRHLNPAERAVLHRCHPRAHFRRCRFVVAFGVSLAVGVVFGMLPANRASQFNPTEALEIRVKFGKPPKTRTRAEVSVRIRMSRVEWNS